MIFRSAGCDGRTFIIILREAVLFNTLRRQWTASKHQQLQLTTNAYESLRSHLPKYFYHAHPDISLFVMILVLKEYHNTLGLRKITKC
jgi:hypothetical protein